MVTSSPQYPRDVNAAPEGPGGAHVIVTVESIYNLLLDVRDGVAETRHLSESRANRIGDDVAAHRRHIEDHEHRIRALERKVWLAAGLAAGSGAGLSQLISALAS